MGKYHNRNNYYGGNKTGQRLMQKEYIKYTAPHLLAAFGLVLYENTGFEKDDIVYLIEQVTPMFNRAMREGWDIRKKAEEMFDIDLMHELEAKERGLM